MSLYGLAVVKKHVGVQLTVECPFCRPARFGRRRVRYHGDAGDKHGPCYGHRTAHCNPQYLPPELRDVSRGYFLIEARLMTVLDEMTALAERLGWTPSRDRDALAVEFGMLLAHRAMALSAVDRRDLFAAWCERCDAREDERIKRIKVLCKDHSKLLLARDSGADVTAELVAIGEEMAALAAPPEYTGPLGEWVTE